MDNLSVVIVMANTVTFLFGTFVTALAFRAYRRTRSSPLRLLGLGLGLVTVGTLVGGVLHPLAGAPLLTSVAITSVFTAVGFVTLGYSLYAEQGPSAPVPAPTR